MKNVATDTKFYVLESFTTMTDSKQAVSYNDVLIRAQHHFEWLMESEFKHSNRNDYDDKCTAVIVSVTYFPGVGYGASTVPSGKLMYDTQKAPILKEALRPYPNTPHAEDNSYKIVEEVATSTGKLAKDAQHYPYGTVQAAFGLYGNEWVPPGCQERLPTVKAKEIEPCHGKDGSRKGNTCKDVAAKLQIANFFNKNPAPPAATPIPTPVAAVPASTPTPGTSRPGTPSSGTGGYGTPPHDNDLHAGAFDNSPLVSRPKAGTPPQTGTPPQAAAAQPATPHQAVTSPQPAPKTPGSGSSSSGDFWKEAAEVADKAAQKGKKTGP